MPPHAFAASLTQARGQRRLIGQVSQRFGQRQRVAGGDQQPGLSVDDHLRDRRDARSHDRPARGHGLQQHQTEAFPDGRHGEDVDGVHQGGHVFARPEHVDSIGYPHLLGEIDKKILQVACAGDDGVRARYAFEEQRHGGDQVPLPLLRRQAADVADQERLGTNAELGADTLAFTFERSGDRRLHAVIDASHAGWVAHAPRDREVRDVVGDGDDQILSRGDQVVDDAHERVEEKAIVVVARRHQQRATLAELGDRQSGVDVGAEQVRVQDVEVAVARQADEPAQRHRINVPARLEQVHGNACLAKHGHQLAFTAQDGGFDGERLVVGVRQKCQEVVFGPAPFERRNQLQDTNRPWRPGRFHLLGEHRLHAALFYGRGELAYVRSAIQASICARSFAAGDTER